MVYVRECMGTGSVWAEVRVKEWAPPRGERDGVYGHWAIGDTHTHWMGAKV